MPVLTYNDVGIVVNHAVKGADYVHGYDANGDIIISLEGITDFSVVSYDGTYMDPDECLDELCNGARYVGGALKTSDGRLIPSSAVGAAPAGYGLGENKPRFSEDLNTEIYNGYFRVQSTTANAPYSHSVGHVRAYNPTETVQNICNTINGYEIVRRTTDGVNWITEYVNPPMVPGVEYRTTERCNGKAVYAQMMDFGYLPNNSAKSTRITTPNNTKSAVVGVGGYFISDSGTTGGELLGLREVVGHNTSVLDGEISFTIVTNGDVSSFKAYPIIRYTKD